MKRRISNACCRIAAIRSPSTGVHRNQFRLVQARAWTACVATRPETFSTASTSRNLCRRLLRRTHRNRLSMMGSQSACHLRAEARHNRPEFASVVGTVQGPGRQSRYQGHYKRAGIVQAVQAASQKPAKLGAAEIAMQVGRVWAVPAARQVAGGWDRAAGATGT